MPEFEVKVDPNHTDLAELCSMYWATNADGSFTHTVKAVADRYEHPPQRVSKIVSEACFAISTSRRCGGCDKGFVYRSRSDWNAGARYALQSCRTCIEAEKRQENEKRERANAAKRAAVNETFGTIDGGNVPVAKDLDLPIALTLAAAFEDAEEIFNGVTAAIVDRNDRLTPTHDLDFKLIEMIINKGLLQVHPSSTLDAFGWQEDGTPNGNFFPMLASYYLPGEGDVAARTQAYLASFAEVCSRENWPDHWVDQFSEFWFDIATAECEAYLVEALRGYGLEFTPGQKTQDVLRRGLKWYSIGQMYYFIWRAARDSAAYHAKGTVRAKQAANSAVTRIASDIDRAYAQGWQVSTYQRISQLPLSTLSHILFSRALNLDNPMSYSPVDLPVRRAGMELAWHKINSEAFERLIFQLVVETDGYENVEWLMHTNAPDHGRDVSAIRLRRDPLSGHSSQRVAIQCKHWLTRPVRDTDANQAIVSIGHWQDPPFDVLVIATSGRFTADAVSWIERHNARGGRPSIEVWNDARLEFLLNERAHLIRAYELR
ncbi:restriction endonuclease [Dactylosporangium vinaceum]|uniref:Restriction endonuclease n=1 Tax=Dactylosporangium vinaceum TaxID=53362 RepID=A0ABV5LZ29_9ACTN|nr:restriction endonuclease [Dactylosporangium vinaceum]UAB95187.1 restriction endonuclease [Dactylosporangium vinaceum]